MRITGVDLDGTLFPFGLKPGEYRGINMSVIKQLAGREVRIISNQGGVPFHYKKYPNSGDFPSAFDICNRINAVWSELERVNSVVTGIYICTYSPRIESFWCGVAKQHLQTSLYEMWGVVKTGIEPYVSDLPSDRKPFPDMLIRALVDEYWGDSDEDEGAATEANIPFIQVARFLGEGYGIL